MSQAVQQQSDASADVGGASDRMDDVSPDDAFELLANQRRRYALHYLKANGANTELGELAEHVASWENDVAKSAVNAAERKRVYTSLQQFHLPKMEDKGVVSFDQRAGTVELTDSAEDLDLYLEVVQDRDVPWSQYYLALTAVNAAVLAAAAIGTWPFTLLPDIAWGLFAVTTVGVSAVAHVYHDRTMRLGSQDKPPEMDA